MMILGIVLHSSETYNVGHSDIWPKDPNNTHLFFNYLSSIIHIFRMPIFFIIAGFFGSLLYYERGAIAMIKNRTARVVLPFIIFLVILHPLILIALGTTTESFGVSLTSFSITLSWFPTITYHLWFLYYLILLTFTSFLLADLLKKVPGITSRILKVYEWFMLRRFPGILVMSFVIFIMLVWMWNTWVPTPLEFAVDFKVFLFYMLFYLTGWLLYKSKHLLETFKKNDWLLFLLGFLIYTSKFLFRDYIDDVLYGTLNALVVWLFVFGIMGLFIRYASSQSIRMRYISDSSYWVYLIHLPLTLFIPGLIVDWPIPAGVKFSVVLISTSVLCFTSYHYLVRSSFVGKFLNGRTYSTSKTASEG